MREKIVVIDDETHIRDTIEEALSAEGFRVQCYGAPGPALKAASNGCPNLVITDLVMPGMDGLSAIQRFKDLSPEVNIVVITGHASLDSAIGAIRAGASDYLTKPFKINELMQAVRKALSQKRIMPSKDAQDEGFQKKYQVSSLIGSTPEMQNIFSLVKKVGEVDSTALIVGESGTGKEMIARAIHYQSKRCGKAFVSINCAALPENLLESELFGYEKGAFTGAAASKVGLFELASDGTFFLDEIGEMSVNLQAKLLRVLQERVVKRVGGIRDITVNFRLIAATSRNLPQEIRGGGFREDLYYRLNVIPLILPALRHRTTDIPEFVRFFLKHYAQKQGTKREFKVTSSAMKVFESYKWPGNIRELENVVERLVTLGDHDEIDEDLAQKTVYQIGGFSPDDTTPIMRTADLRRSVETYERELIERAVREADGNKNQAARKLNMTRQALQYKLNKYKIAS